MKDINDIRQQDSVRLALLRTELSNRRTLLAYIKTALWLLISGIGIQHVKEQNHWMVGFAMVLVLAAVVTLCYGVWDHRRSCRIIAEERDESQV